MARNTKQQFDQLDSGLADSLRDSGEGEAPTQVACEQAVNISDLARQYAARDISWPELRDKHDIHFSDLLSELADQGLALPLLRSDQGQARARDRFIEAMRNDAAYQPHRP